MAGHGQFTVKEDSEVAGHVRALDERTAELVLDQTKFNVQQKILHI